jgi:glycosyltransferase involved in cell wall biosynthesis
MRILQIVKNFDFGGAENHVCELANMSCDNGHDVFVISKNGRQKNRLASGVHFKQLKLMDVLLPVQIAIVVYFVRRHKIQVIHAHQRLPIFLAAIVGKLVGIPVVVTVHGSSKHDLRSPVSRWWVNRFVFVSQKSMGNFAQNHPVFKDKSVFLPNGVHTSNHRIEPLFGKLCYVSRVDKKHAEVITLFISKVLPDLLVDYPSITFHVVGEGDGLADVQCEADKCNRAYRREVCHIEGYRPNAISHVNNCSLVMGVGRVAIEGLVRGVPVLSVNIKRMGSIITCENYDFYKRNNFIHVESDHPQADSLRDAMRDFLANFHTYRLEAQKLKDLVADDFDIRKISAKIELGYKELIGEG